MKINSNCVLISIIAILLANSSFVFAYNEDLYEIHHNRLEYSFEKPNKWTFQIEKELNQGNYVVLNIDKFVEDSVAVFQLFPYSYDTYYNDFPSIMIYSKSKIDAKCLSKKCFLDSLSSFYKDEFIPVEKSNNVIQIENEHKIEFNDFTGLRKAFYLSLGIIEEGDYFIAFILITRSNKDYEAYYNDFEKLVKSYKFITDTAEIYHNDYVRELDFEELEKLKKSDYNRYLGEVCSLRYLELAYKYKSKSMLDTFFHVQSKGSIPISNEELAVKPDFEREVYEIFKLILTPPNLVNYSKYLSSKSEMSYDREEDHYSDAKYLLVQNQINVTLYDTVSIEPANYHVTYQKSTTKKYLRELSKLTIRNLCPELQIENREIVYCDESLLSVLKQFLGVPVCYGSDVITNPISEVQVEKRMKFLNQFISISRGDHGFGFWYDSFPIISSIMLNVNLSEAIIRVISHYSYGSIVLKKIDSKWVISTKPLYELYDND